LLPLRSLLQTRTSLPEFFCKYSANSAVASTARLRLPFFLLLIRSICVGAIFVGNLGIFDCRYSTTHWECYNDLAEYNYLAARRTCSEPGKVLPARFVDSGLNENQIRIISSGGVSCGIDACLHVVNIRAGPAEALDTAKRLDYAWRQTDGVTFGNKYCSSKE
jgi:hypothetical protein